MAKTDQETHAYCQWDFLYKQLSHSMQRIEQEEAKQLVTDLNKHTVWRDMPGHRAGVYLDCSSQRFH